MTKAQPQRWSGRPDDNRAALNGGSVATTDDVMAVAERKPAARLFRLRPLCLETKQATMASG